MLREERELRDRILDLCRWANVLPQYYLGKVKDLVKTVREDEAALRAMIAERDAALSAKEKAEIALCRAKKLMKKVHGDWSKSIPEDQADVSVTMNVMEVFLEDESFPLPCPHEEEAKRLWEVIQWAHAPVNVFAFDPAARDAFLAELDRRAGGPA